MSKGTPRRGAALALVIAIATVAIAVILPSAAFAAGGLSPGVHVDPGSPAAKEYQIPLGAARGNGQSGSSTPSSLFGQGITPAHTTSADTTAPASSAPATAPATAPAASTAARVRHHRRHHAPQHRHHRSHHHQAAIAAGTAGPGSGGGAPAPSPARAIGTGSGSGTGITWMLGAAVAVLLLGGLGGSILARRDRRAREPKQAGQTSPHAS